MPEVESFKYQKFLIMSSINLILFLICEYAMSTS